MLESDPYVQNTGRGMVQNILGGMSIKHFLKHYWQKKPLFIRQAFPQFKSFVDKQDLMTLSTQDDVLSRLVINKNNIWGLMEGPFKKSDFKKIDGKWTLLVQGINHFLPEGQALLTQFNFIPYARLDDLMISYASPGGGVGPHLDSYDVFLLQGNGQRLWQISNQKNTTLKTDVPLKILKKFKSTEEWVLDPGDMLYLPPNYAHHGVAIDECITYSIGFRAPSHNELVFQYLGYLQNHFQIEGIYQDLDLSYSKEPAKINTQMITKVKQVIQKIEFNDIEKFLGNYLTEPKPNLYISSPEHTLTLSQFTKHIKKFGITLDLKVCMLYTKNNVYINGECYSINNNLLKELANIRQLESVSTKSKLLIALLYDWYQLGYIHTHEHA